MCSFEEGIHSCLWKCCPSFVDSVNGKYKATYMINYVLITFSMNCFFCDIKTPLFTKFHYTIRRFYIKDTCVDILSIEDYNNCFNMMQILTILGFPYICVFVAALIYYSIISKKSILCNNYYSWDWKLEQCSVHVKILGWKSLACIFPK